MGDFAQQIVALLSSRHYQELATFDPPFDPMEVLGVSGRELSYSSVLAWLLRDPVNRGFRQSFLAWVAKNGLSFEASKDEPIEIKREYGDQEAGRIDVFVNFPRRKLVIAIEVKVWAEEGQDQISRYQNFLSSRFADSCKMVVFLTRCGYKPKSKGKSPCVPVLEMSWREVADMLGDCPGQGEESDFRAQFREHIHRSVLMQDEGKRKIVIDLLRQGDNAKTIRTIIDNYPNIGDDEYVDRWKKIVSEAVNNPREEVNIPEEEFKVQKYPARGNDTKELRITVRKWTEGGLPFTLMLYKYGNASVRVLLHHNEYHNNKDKLDEFSESTDGIVGDFPPVANWSGTWHSVLKCHGSQEEPSETLIEKEIWEDCFWVQAEEKLKKQLDPLKKKIEEWIKS